MISQRLHRGLVASLSVVAVLLLFRAEAPSQTEPSAPGVEKIQPLSRGPIHEAFAQPTVFDPKPGMIVPKEPPKQVEEIPPEQKPEGDNVAWVPGYWSWDPEASNFLWVSGIWRIMPPGRQWIPGYWKKLDIGHQWVSGFWATAGSKGLDYLPTPPPSLEIGPSSEAPGPDFIWSPGCWRWRDFRYLWQPGCWIGVQPDWIWCPPSYHWTPSGCVFTDGFWDHLLPRRGLLFAPVCFTEPLFLRAGFCFTPRICINFDTLTDHFFCWPSYRHYCFGNFYSDFHAGCGIRPWFSFHGQWRQRWCDPIFSHRRWDQCRRDPDWHNGVRRNFEQCRLNEHARPGIQHDQARAANGKSDLARPVLTKPIEQLAANSDRSMKLGKLDAEGRREIGARSAELQRLREQRGLTESQAARDVMAKTIAGASRSHRLDLPGSPITAKPGNDLPKPRGGVKSAEVQKPGNSSTSRGAAGGIDLSRSRTEPGRPGGSAGSDSNRLLPRGGDGLPPAGLRMEPRREVQPGRNDSMRADPSPRLAPRSDPGPRLPSITSPRMDSRPRVDSAPRLDSSPRYSSAPQSGNMPRLSSPSRSSAGPGMRSGSRGSGASRSSGMPSRSSGGGRGRR